MAQDQDVYPWIYYKGAAFWQTPPIKENPEEHFRRIKELKSREDDILLLSSMKSGTHWLHEIVSMLLNQTTEYNTKGDFIKMHFEFINMNDVECVKEQRLMHTHLPISWLPVEHLKKHRKTIYINRNPKDIYASRYNFFHGKRGFPDMTWSEFYDSEIMNEVFLTGWFNYTKEMTAAVHNEGIDIIQVLYEDLLLETKAQVIRIAKYLEVPYTEEFIDKIVDKCKFVNLKDHKLDASRHFHEDGLSTLFRKGVIGDWKNWFTVAQNEEFETIYRKEMQNVDVQFTFEPPQ